MDSRVGLLIALLILCAGRAAPVRAQDVPAPEDPVTQALRDVEDETRPLTFRAQIVARLLMEKNPGAMAALSRLLLSPDRPADLRLTIVTAALGTPGLPLFSDVFQVVRNPEDPEFLEQVENAFRLARSPELVRELARRAQTDSVPERQRLLAIRLLGRTGSLDAAAPLIALWKSGGPEVGAAAQAGLHRIVHVRFESPEQAEAFFAAHAGEDLETILGQLLDDAKKGGQADPAMRRLVAMARALLDQASLTGLVEQFLGCRESAEVRRMGAERLRTYPYAEREKDGEAEARKLAAKALLDGLAKEEDPGVATAELGALSTLAAGAKAVDPERATRLVMERLESPDPKVQLAAVSTLGVLKDKLAIPDLCRHYETAGPDATEYRVAVLDALGKIGDGISDWILGRLAEKPADDAVTLRLVQLLKMYPEGRDSIPVLVDLLQNSKAPRVRQEVAFALGSIGVKAGDSAAIDALAVFGLADENASVREISATQLGGAPKVAGKVVELLRERLKEGETENRVKIAASWSLLKLCGVEAVPWLSAYLKEDEFWNGAFRNFLASNVIADGKSAEALAFLRAVAAAGADARVVEAARRVLDAKELTFDGAARGGRAEVLMLMAEALGRLSKPADALAVLNAEEQSVSLEGDAEFRFRLLKAKLLRETGAADRGADEMTRLLGREGLPPEYAARARLELGRCRLALEQYAEAEKALAPLQSDPKLGKEVGELLKQIRAATAAKAPPPKDAAAWVEDLDNADEAVRGAAVEALKKLGKPAWPALLTWLDSKPPDGIPGAVKVLAEITALKLVYDPAAPEAERKAALAAIRKALSG